MFVNNQNPITYFIIEFCLKSKVKSIKKIVLLWKFKQYTFMPVSQNNTSQNKIAVGLLCSTDLYIKSAKIIKFMFFRKYRLSISNEKLVKITD